MPAKKPKLQGKDGTIRLSGKKVATKTDWSLNLGREAVDASLFGDINKTYLAGLTDIETTTATTSGGSSYKTSSEVDQAARDYIRKQIGDLQADNHRLMEEKKRMQETMEDMRDILRVAAERMGGEFIALESELSANEDRIVVQFDDLGNGHVTVIPEWVRTDQEEGNQPVDLLMPHANDMPEYTASFGSGGTYKITGTFNTNSTWTSGLVFEPLSDKSQTK